MNPNRNSMGMPEPGRARISRGHERRIAPLSGAATRPPHRGGILWMTGLSGSGKSTLAGHLHAALAHHGWRSYILDGDLLRETLNADLGYSAADRRENVRRAGEVAALFANAGHIVIGAFISPYRDSRDRLRTRLDADFHEIHLCTSLEVCEARDPKQLYRRARSGAIAAFTGIDDPYEAPLHPELRLDTDILDAEQCTSVLLDYTQRCFSLQPGSQGTGRTKALV